MNYDRGALKCEVKDDLRRTRPKAIWVSLVFLVISGLLSAAVTLIQGIFTADSAGLLETYQSLMWQVEMGMMDDRELLSGLLALSDQLGGMMLTGVVFGLISAVINWTLAFGYQGYCLDMVRGKNPGFSRLACALPRWGWVLLTGLLVGLFTWLWSILFCIGAAVLTGVFVVLIQGSMGVTLSIVAWLAAAAGMVVVTLRYSMSNFILLDEKVDSLEAISRSKAMMRGRKWHLFVLELSFIGWLLLVGLIGTVAGGIVALLSLGGFAYDPWQAMAGMSLGWMIVVELVTLPLLIWLQPYLVGSQAKFYDWMKQADHEQGIWEGVSRPEPPSIPRYEEARPAPTPPAPPAPETPEPPQPPAEVPDRPDYE